MKILLTCLLFLTGTRAFAAQEKVTLAALSFINHTGQMHLGHLEKTITEHLKNNLAGYPELAVVEREQIDKIMQEQALAQTGALKDDQAVKVGRLSNARYIVYGEFSGTPRKLTILAQVADVNTGQLTSEKVTGNSDQHLAKMTEILAYNIRHNLTGQGGHVDKYKVSEGWYGTLAVAATVSAVTTGVLYALYHDSYNEKYLKATRLDDFDLYYNRANTLHKGSIFFAYTTGGLTAATLWLWLKSFSASNYIHAGSEIPDAGLRPAVVPPAPALAAPAQETPVPAAPADPVTIPPTVAPAETTTTP
jgi:TolB-like protein